jgi:hypothetical protein
MCNESSISKITEMICYIHNIAHGSSTYNKKRVVGVHIFVSIKYIVLLILNTSESNWIQPVFSHSTSLRPTLILSYHLVIGLSIGHFTSGFHTLFMALIIFGGEYKL